MVRWFSLTANIHIVIADQYNSKTKPNQSHLPSGILMSREIQKINYSRFPVKYDIDNETST